MRIYARNTLVKEISSHEAEPFLKEYHKQGNIHSTVYFGLYYNDELVQVETFGVPRIEMQANHIWHDWELYRECSKKDYYVIGGKSKLLKAFEDKYKPLALLSYCNLTEGFDGHSYAACGFNLERTSEDYYYEYNGEIIKRYRMQKNSNLRAKGLEEPIEKTLKLFGKSYDCNLTETQNAERAGFKTIIGKGQQVWSKYYSDDIGYVYEIIGPDGKTYIGQHILRKNGKLKKVDYFGSGVYLNRAVEKYGKKAFKIKVLEWTNDLNTLTELEYKYITEAKANGKAEYNISTNPYDAASHYSGKCGVTHHTDETKRKISEANKGKPKTIETRIKLSEALLGRKRGSKYDDYNSNVVKVDIDKEEQPKVISESEQKTMAHSNYKNRKPRAKDSYTDEWKAKVAEQTKLKMEEAKQKDIEYIHSLGYITTDDLLAKGWTYGQTRRLVPIGKYKRIKYFKPL